MTRLFAERGASVHFTYLSSQSKAEALAKSLSVHAPVKAYCSDASEFQQTDTLIQTIVKDAGRIDILVNNAGITQDALVLRMQEEAWDKVLRTNLKSCFNTTKHVARQMLRQRSGSIINITSVAGLRGNVGQANYSASKAGMIGFTKSVAQELGTIGVRCNAIAPGFIETDMTHAVDKKALEQWQKLIPLQKIGRAIDVAEVACFLASDAAAYITGQTIQVDGGMRL